MSENLDGKDQSKVVIPAPTNGATVKPETAADKPLESPIETEKTGPSFVKMKSRRRLKTLVTGRK